MRREAQMLAAFERFLAEAGSDPAAEVAAAAAAQHLAPVTADALPVPAQAHWRDLTRLLKVPAEKPISEKALAGMKSWPTARVVELIEQARKIHAVLEKAENERLEDEIRDSIRRHYL